MKYQRRFPSNAVRWHAGDTGDRPLQDNSRNQCDQSEGCQRIEQSAWPHSLLCEHLMRGLRSFLIVDIAHMSLLTGKLSHSQSRSTELVRHRAGMIAHTLNPSSYRRHFPAYRTYASRRTFKNATSTAPAVINLRARR